MVASYKLPVHFRLDLFIDQIIGFRGIFKGYPFVGFELREIGVFVEIVTEVLA